MTTAGNSLITSARNATLPDLLHILTKQREASLDVVASGDKFGFRMGQLVLDEIPAQMDETGVRPAEAGGTFSPLASFDYHLGLRLGIPRGFLRTLRDTRPDQYDSLVNGLLHGGTDADGNTYAGDPGKFMLRMFRGAPGENGIVRSLLSNGYQAIDNLDILATAMATVTEMIHKQVREALGLDPAAEVTEADMAMFAALFPEGAPGIGGGYEVRNIQLTDEAMRVRIYVPGIEGHAKVMADGYLNPFREGGAQRVAGYAPPAKMNKGDIVNPFVDFVNNEIGKGSYQIIPGYELCICGNGQTVPKFAVKTVHAGARLDEGLIEWSDETRQAGLKLAMSKTRDALRKFLDPGFLQTVIDESEKRAGVPVADTAGTIEVVAKACDFTDTQAADILRMFTLGGQLTTAGIANAVTAAAQVQTRPEDAMKLDYAAMDAMNAAADFAEAATR